MRSFSRILKIVALVLAIPLINGYDDHDHESKLMARLLSSNYDNRARPPTHDLGPVIVDFRFDMRQIYEVSAATQTVSILGTTYQQWRDPRLKWNTSDYGGLESFGVYYSHLWTPDTMLYNSVDMYRPNVEDRGNAVVKLDDENDTEAWVILWTNTRHTIACSFDMTYFPFDEQNCTLSFESWTYDQTQVDYHLTYNHVTTEAYIKNIEWKLVSFNITTDSTIYVCCKHPFKVIYAHLVIKRRSRYYVFNQIFPTIVINIMDTFGLFASAGNAENRHDKLQIGITTLLAYCILLLTVSDQIPKGSTTVPLISWYFLAVMLQNAIKMYVAISLSYPGRRKWFKSGFMRLGGKLKRCMRMITRRKVHSVTKESNICEDHEAHWPEIVCFWISLFSLIITTSALFAVANFRVL